MAPFAGIHICPASPLDVPDEQSARLVVLPPKAPWKGENDLCPALKLAGEILEQRGNSPRAYKNMLIFLAPDKSALDSLEQEVRHYLAWSSIKKDSEDLNLDAAQNRETENSLGRSSEVVDMRMHDAWCWLFLPAMDRGAMKNAQWEITRLSGKEDNLVVKAAKKLAQNEQIIENWAPALLLMELDNLLWKDARYLEVGKLWEYLAAYCYLPRLADYSVLESAIRRGVESDQYFGYVAGIGQDRYIDLKFNGPAQIDRSGYLIKRKEAIAQIERVSAERAAGTREIQNGAQAPAQAARKHGVNETGESYTGASRAARREETPKLTRFYLNAKLDNTRINRDVDKIMSEVLRHIARDGILEIRLEAQAVSPNGFDQQTVRTASENCRTLKIDDFGFDEE